MRDVTKPDVWAPNATRVDLMVDGVAHPMAQGPGGWWLAPRLAPGTRYGYRLDGGTTLPDPRALSQPGGVHAPSQIVDPATLFGREGAPSTWTQATPSGTTSRNAPWAGREVRGSVIYELHIGCFTSEGTFDATIERLDDLLDLGVQTLEVMPIAPFPGERGWGYDGVGLYGVHAAYGGPEAFARFVGAAHARGLAVVLDVVYNHLGPEGNYLAQFGPYFTGAHHTPWGDAINLDGVGSEHVRAFLLGAARQWLVDFELDGLRLDAVHELADDSGVHFLAELAEHTERWRGQTGRPLTLIAESDLNQPAMVSPLGSVPGARGMDAQWADDVHHALHSFLTGERQGYYVDFGSAQTLQQALTRVFVHDGAHSTFRETEWGAPVDPASPLYDGHSFVVFLQNHDQVGNRATGDRIGHGLDPALQAAGAALYLLSAYTPMIFMGEEWGTSSPFPYFSHLGPELGPKVTQGRRREFAEMEWHGEVPDPQSPATPHAATLPWAERAEPDHARMLAWYRLLIAMRAAPDIADAALTSVAIEVLDGDTLTMRRGGYAVTVTRAERTIEGDAEILASWPPAATQGGRWRMPGPGVVITRGATVGLAQES